MAESSSDFQRHRAAVSPRPWGGDRIGDTERLEGEERLEFLINP